MFQFSESFESVAYTCRKTRDLAFTLHSTAWVNAVTHTVKIVIYMTYLYKMLNMFEKFIYT